MSDKDRQKRKITKERRWGGGKMADRLAGEDNRLAVWPQTLGTHPNYISGVAKP